MKRFNSDDSAGSAVGNVRATGDVSSKIWPSALLHNVGNQERLGETSLLSCCFWALGMWKDLK